MSVSRQFAAISVPPRTRKRKAPAQAVTVSVAATPQKRSKSMMGAQIPRGFVSPLAADSKYFDTAIAGAQSIDTTGFRQHLDIITQGDAVTQRNGKAWVNTNVQLRGYISNKTTAITNHVGMYLIWDRQPNKALAAVTDILDSANAYSLMKRENKSRFVTIKKWQRVLIGNSTTPSTGREAVLIDKWVKLPAESIAQTTAADTTGAIGNRITGALILVAVGSNIAGTAAAEFNGTFYIRIGFKDPNN